MHVEVVRYRDRLDYLFKQISAFSGDIELQAHWAKYLCILVSGFLESSVQSIFSEYAKSKAAPSVANYVENRLRGLQNTNMQRILDVTRSFNPDWADQLETATEGELRDAVNSIVANRNQIAHGVSIGLSYVRMKDYYDQAVKLVNLLDEVCDS